MNIPLSELICTRISHDLIGNIGAVGNAVELLEDGDIDFLDDIKSILQTSSFTLSARLKFFRMAFGLDNASLDNKDVVLQVTKDYLQTIGNKNFPIIIEASDISSKNNRYFMLSIMILADLFVRGGKIIITEQSEKLCCVAQTDTNFASEKAMSVKRVLGGDVNEQVAWLAPSLYLYTCAKEKNLIINFEHDNSLKLEIG